MPLQNLLHSHALLHFLPNPTSVPVTVSYKTFFLMMPSGCIFLKSPWRVYCLQTQAVDGLQFALPSVGVGHNRYHHPQFWVSQVLTINHFCRSPNPASLSSQSEEPVSTKAFGTTSGSEVTRKPLQWATEDVTTLFSGFDKDLNSTSAILKSHNLAAGSFHMKTNLHVVPLIIQVLKVVIKYDTSLLNTTTFQPTIPTPTLSVPLHM